VAAGERIRVPDDTRGERDKLEREFFSEAEEIFETLATELRLLELDTARGRWNPGRINSLFREVHTIKGLAGMQGLRRVSELAHGLEDLLQRLRLEAAAPASETLSLIQESFDALGALVRGAGSTEPAPGATDLQRRLRDAASRGPGEVPNPRASTRGLDAALTASLSAYEEHRLAEVRRTGTPLYLVRLRLDPREFDARLRDAVQNLETQGEVICTVPTFGGGSDSALLFCVMVASSAGLPAIRGALRGFSFDLEAPHASGGSPPPAVADGWEDDLRGVSATVRVPVARLDELLAKVGDLSIAVASAERTAQRAAEARPAERDVLELSREVRALLPRLRALQRGTIEARLVPVGQMFGRIGRMVARAARAAGKDVELHALGGDTELDKAMMDQLVSPLVHLLRNALDHGLETPEERARAGKARAGRIVLSAFARGHVAVVDVIDDGRGISKERVRRVAETSGLIRPGEAISDAQACELIFTPGFSTARRVTESSGRGVGLDAVRKALRRLKGTIEVRSEEGKGTTISITVPITLALVHALIVRAGAERFAIPVLSIRENVRLEASRRRRVGGGEVYDHPQGSMPLVSLDGLTPTGSEGRDRGGEKYVVVAGPPGGSVAIAVDGFLGQEDVVIKPIGRRLQDLPGLAGATDLGDSRAVLVIDPESLVAARDHGQDAP
jgi:two-component system, chemotaxis family, sensor kinase CheA